MANQGPGRRAGPLWLVWASVWLVVACGGLDDPAAKTADAKTTAGDTQVHVGSDEPDVAEAPQIQVLPPVVQFGAVELGQANVKTIRICNVGTLPLTIHNIEVVAPLPGVQVSVAIDLPVVIAPPDQPGGCSPGLTVQITLTTKQLLIDAQNPSMTLVAQLALHSDDPQGDALLIKLWAKSALPQLALNVADKIDFGKVQIGQLMLQTIELRNDGEKDLTISKMSIVDDTLGEFYILPDPAFGPAAPTPTEAVLAPGEATAVTLVAKPTGVMYGTATGTLVIASNDPLSPLTKRPLLVYRLPVKLCDVVLSPMPLEFGPLAYGTIKTIKLNVHNKGAGTCKFQSVHVTDCPSSGFGGIQQKPVCNTSGSTKFKVSAPSVSLFQLGPNMKGSIQVVFQAPEDLGLFGEPNALTPFHALMVATFVEAETGLNVMVPNIPIYDPSAVAAATPNMVATVGKSDVAVSPAAVQFGAVPVGCKSAPTTIGMLSSGSIAGEVSKVEFVGCGGAFVGKDWPDIQQDGWPLSSSAATELQVQFAPLALGPVTCQLAVWTANNGICTEKNGTSTGTYCNAKKDCDPQDVCLGFKHTVNLTGHGVLDEPQTEVFPQGPTAKMDILLIVDDSGSMAAKQTKLQEQIPALIAKLDAAAIDYHIGVVSTDMDDGSKSGKLQPWAGLRILTNQTPTVAIAAQGMVFLGSNGSGTEQGLAAMEAALTEPLTADLPTPCTSDQDCSLPAKCFPDAQNPSQQHCGGANRSFLRPAADLAVIVLSDEEDGSSADTAHYVNLLLGLKANVSGKVKLHAIVGPPNGCAALYGDAVAGTRYIAVAKATEGTMVSICQDDYSDIWTAVVEPQAVGHNIQLAANADPTSIVIKTGGQTCVPNGVDWLCQPALRLLSLLPGSKCGQVGQSASVTYDLYCAP